MTDDTHLLKKIADLIKDSEERTKKELSAKISDSEERLNMKISDSEERLNMKISDSEERLNMKISDSESRLRQVILDSQEDTIETLKEYIHTGYNMHNKRIEKIEDELNLPHPDKN